MTIVLLSEAVSVGAGEAGEEVHGLDFKSLARLVWPRGASALLGPRLSSLPCITGFFGNQHGSRCSGDGSWGCCGGAQQNAGPARRWSRNHPV